MYHTMICAALYSSLCGLANDPVPVQKQAVPFKERRPLKESYNGQIEAVVTKIESDKFTLRLLRWTKANYQDEHWYDGSEKLHTVALSDYLAAGRDPKRYNVLRSSAIDTDETYRRDDAKVGDRIEYTSMIIDGKEECISFSIRRRPGGLVPSSRFEIDEKIKNGHHKRMQVEQDYEERGTPIPDKLVGKLQEQSLDARWVKIKAILKKAQKQEKK